MYEGWVGRKYLTSMPVHRSLFIVHYLIRQHFFSSRWKVAINHAAIAVGLYRWMRHFKIMKKAAGLRQHKRKTTRDVAFTPSTHLPTAVFSVAIFVSSNARHINDSCKYRPAPPLQPIGPSHLIVCPLSQPSPARQVAVHPMEKDFIRSLAEIEDEVWTDNTAPPLLSPRLQSSPADWPSATSGCDPTVKSTRDSADVADASDAATMTVSAGPRKTLVLDLDETLVSSSRKPCSCDYKVCYIYKRRWEGVDEVNGRASIVYSRRVSYGPPPTAVCNGYLSRIWS